MKQILFLKIMGTKNLVFGIDVGTNSVGWAVLDGEENFLDGGVRVFPEPLKAKTKAPKNVARRMARGTRKQIKRRSQRKNNVKNILAELGFLPKEKTEQEQVFAQKNPFELRKKALDEKLEKFELGRIFAHLAKKRGFLSNRKSGNSEEGVVYAGIHKIADAMQKNGSRTIGEYFFDAQQKGEIEKIKGEYTLRSMYTDEFQKIWSKQSKFYGDFSPEKRQKLFDAIFYQRPLQSQKGKVGMCSFEPNLKRAQKASLVMQEFLMWQDINNLKYQLPHEYVFASLSDMQKKDVALLLSSESQISYSSLNKHLHLPKETVWNLKQTGKKELSGNKTIGALKSALGESKFSALEKEKQEKLVELLITTENPDGIKKSLLEKWIFSEEEANKLLKASFPSGYGNLSQKAMRKMIPFLQKGMRYDEAAKLAGYNHFEKAKKPTENFEVPLLRNPSVEKSLHEVKKILRLLEKKFGIPDAIHVEMARELKISNKEKSEKKQQNDKNQEKRNRAKRVLVKKNMPESKDFVLKYQLWKESKKICPYTGEQISIKRLLRGDIDIEHILPYSRSFDDSFMNKTLCVAKFNRDIKKNKTPFELGEENETWFEQMGNRLENLKKMPNSKKRRFLQKDLDTNEQVGRMLNDTRYIGREVKKMIERKMGNITVNIGNGKLTAMLRHLWGMEEIMPKIVDSETGEIKKNRGDNRHHFIDAYVIAKTSKSLLQEASTAHAQDKLHEIKHIWKHFAPTETEKQKVQKKFDAMIISHAPTRKIDGQLHEQTAYGKIEEGKYVKRVFLSGISAKNIENIRDAEVKKLVQDRVEEYGGDIKKAFGNVTENPFFHKDGKTKIESVRVMISKGDQGMMSVKNEDGEEYKFYPTGGNHHIEIIESTTQKNKNGTFKRAGVVISTLEAHKRARQQKIPVVNRTGPWTLPNGSVANPNEWKFVMSLCANDLMEVEKEEGKKEYFRVQNMTQKARGVIEVTIRNHLAANTENNKDQMTFAPNTSHKCKKIQIDPIGKIFSAGD